MRLGDRSAEGNSAALACDLSSAWVLGAGSALGGEYAASMASLNREIRPMRFSIRDLLWATLVMAMGLAWWIEGH
jgi:hypothetical protein